MERHKDKSSSLPSAQARYSPETLSKVVELASRIQMDTRETLTAEEVEAIGKEVGLDAIFVRQAMEEFIREHQAAGTRTRIAKATIWKSISAGWWAAGWTVPFILITATHGDLGAPLFFLGWAIYIGGGMLLTAWTKVFEVRAEPPRSTLTRLSRSDLLTMLFALQRLLEGQRQRRDFLSVDVVGSSEMKSEANELEAEYSFQQFHRWLEGIVAKHGGQIHSVAGDGAMCMFPDDSEAVKTALELQKEIAQFNATQNLLSVPFRIRCGVSAGNVPVANETTIGQIHSHVLDRAAILQKRAKPGSIVVSGEVAGAALMLLGEVSPLTDPPNGQPAFEWIPEGEKFSGPM